jgi:hypothetical protein
MDTVFPRMREWPRGAVERHAGMMSGSLRVGSGRRSGQRFDARHGVVTEALIFLGELDPEHIGDALADATHYEPTPLAQFDELLRALPIAHDEYTFVDIGAGMGRVLLLASTKPFKHIVGVEVSPALCQTARDNVTKWRQSRPDAHCKDVRVVCKDAASFRFPNGNLVFYLYNPFGESTMRRLVYRIAQECSGSVFLVYHTPVHRDVVDENRCFTLLVDLGFGTVYEKKTAT